MQETTAERIASRYKVEGECWVWQRALTNNGYGAMRHDGKMTLAHRVSYELAVGPIPAGLVIDHLCRNRACVNPAHLEPVTNKVNILRGESASAQNARKTHCIRGHELVPSNIKHRRNGKRNCRKCISLEDKAYRAKRRAA